MSERKENVIMKKTHLRHCTVFIETKNPCISGPMHCSNHTAPLELALNSSACAQGMETQLRKYLLKDKPEWSLEWSVLCFLGCFFVAVGRSQTESRAVAIGQISDSGAKDQEWTLERARSSVTTEGLVLGLSHCNRELQEAGKLSGRPVVLSRARANDQLCVLSQNRAQYQAILGLGGVLGKLC